MAFCSQCGTDVGENSKFCPSCGAPVGNTSSGEQKKNDDFSAKAEDAFNKFNDTPDSTDSYDPADIESNKVMGVLAYLSWLVLVPLLAAPNSPYARFHANQGLVLAIIEIVCSVVLGMLSWIPFFGWVFGTVLSLLGIVALVFSILGIINAVNGRAKELPLVGKIKLLK